MEINEESKKQQSEAGKQRTAVAGQARRGARHVGEGACTHAFHAQRQLAKRVVRAFNDNKCEQSRSTRFMQNKRHANAIKGHRQKSHKQLVRTNERATRASEHDTTTREATHAPEGQRVQNACCAEPWNEPSSLHTNKIRCDVKI